MDQLILNSTFLVPPTRTSWRFSVTSTVVSAVQALAGGCLVARALLKTNRLHTSQKPLLSITVIASCLFLLISSPLAIDSLLNAKWRLGTFACKVSLLGNAIFVNFLHLQQCVVAVQRYVHMIHDKVVIADVKMILLSMISTFTIACLPALPYALNLGTIGTLPSCLILLPKGAMDLALTICIFGLGFLVTATCYILMLTKTPKAAFYMHATEQQDCADAELEGRASPNAERRAVSRDKATSMSIMLFTYYMTTVCATAPLYVIRYFGATQFVTYHGAMILCCPSLYNLAAVSHVWIFPLASKDLRLLYKDAFWRSGTGRGPRPWRSEGHQVQLATAPIRAQGSMTVTADQDCCYEVDNIEKADFLLPELAQEKQMNSGQAMRHSTRNTMNDFHTQFSIEDPQCKETGPMVRSQDRPWTSQYHLLCSSPLKKQRRSMSTPTLSPKSHRAKANLYTCLSPQGVPAGPRVVTCPSPQGERRVPGSVQRRGSSPIKTFDKLGSIDKRYVRFIQGPNGRVTAVFKNSRQEARLNWWWRGEECGGDILNIHLTKNGHCDSPMAHPGISASSNQNLSVAESKRQRKKENNGLHSNFAMLAPTRI